MTIKELKEKYYIEVTCLEDYYHMRDKATHGIAWSGSEEYLKQVISELMSKN